MKKFLTFTLLGLISMTSASKVMALSVDLQQGAYSYGNGGEFVAAAPAADPSLSIYLANYSSLAKYTGNNGLFGFGTFCLEYNEEFSPGSVYNVTISANAMYGGMAPNGDPISKGTALLYYDFATGNQTFGYDWSAAGRKNSAGQFQQAIWWLEGEGGVVYDVNNVFMNLALTTFGANAMADSGGLYNVAVMNLGAPGTTQDQLILTGTSDIPPVVPDTGMTLLLLSMAAGGMFLIRHKLA